MLKDVKIINKEFNNKIIYIVNINCQLLDELKAINDIEINILDNIYIST